MPADVYQVAPAESLDPGADLLVHWGVLTADEDPFSAGARWAIAAAYDQIFGDALGELLLQATQLQRWDATAQAWADVV